jgi:hypothetical protein
LFRGEAIEWGSGDVEESEVEIDLTAMMDFVFDHEAEPLPCGDGSGVRSLAFALEVGVREPGENLQGFSVEAVHEREDVVEAIGQIFGVGSVASGLVLDAFGPHVALGDGNVAKEIAEGEFSGSVGPIDFVGRDAASDAKSAFANVAEIMEEGLDGEDFHGELNHIAG